jgi:hypothetical protein
MTQDRKAGTVLKRKPQPSNPRSAAQTGNRGMFGFVGAEWANLTDEEKLSWETIANSQQISNFAAYSQKNAVRWQQGKTPSKETPAAESATPTAAGTLTITSRNDAPDTASFSFTAAATDWGVIFYRGSGGAPTGVKSEVIAVRACTPGEANVIAIDHDGATADVIKVAVFTEDGVRSALIAAA